MGGTWGCGVCIPYVHHTCHRSYCMIHDSGSMRQLSQLCRLRDLADPARFVVQARLAKNRKKFGQHLSRDYCPPGHENPAMGFFWGVDQDAIVDLLKKLFLTKFEPQNRENLHSLFWSTIAIDRAW